MCGPNTIFIVLKMFVAILCTVLFAIVTAKIVEKYLTKNFHSEINFSKSDGSFPAVTFCPVKAFKTKGFFFAKNEFLQNTYTMVINYYYLINKPYFYKCKLLFDFNWIKTKQLKL